MVKETEKLSSTEIPLRILLVEDSEPDAELVLLCLERAGYRYDCVRVETARQMRDSLSEKNFDLIISDFSLPAFSGSDALAVAAELCPDVPLIIVSGNIGEETAVRLMLEGARDYVMKQNLSRLVPAIERELVESKNRAQSRRLQALLEQITNRLFTQVGHDFFETLVKVLAEALGTNCAYVAIFDHENHSGSTLAFYHRNQYVDEINYDLNGSPCEQVIRDHYYQCNGNLAELFPTSEVIVKSGMASYAGLALVDNKGVVIGSIAVMDEQDIKARELANNVLGICASRAVSEYERLRGEQALRRSEATMSSILNNMQDVLFRIDMEGLIEWVTPSIFALLGHTSEQVIGLPYNSIFVSRTGPTTLKGVLDEHDGSIQNLELPMRHRDGQSVWVSINAHYFHDEKSGRIIGVEGAARNITQRRLAEAALRQSEELFASAFHASPAMMSISRLADDYNGGVFLDVNDAFLNAIGYTRNEVVGSSSEELGLFVTQEQRNEFFNTLKSDGVIRNIEVPFRTKTGDIRYGLGSVEVLQIGGDVCVLVVCQDITERKKTDEELVRYREHLEEQISQRTSELSSAVNDLEMEVAERRRIEIALVDAMTYVQLASKSKSEFLANMSHELRTPLNSIIGFSELLMLDADDNNDSDSKEKISYILDSAWMLLSLINDILDLSKIESGKMSLVCEPTLLSELLGACMAMFRDKASKQEIHLSLENNYPGDYINIDSRRVKQMLINLLSNAIKFTTSGGRVTLKVSALSGEEFTECAPIPDAAEPRFGSFIRFEVIDTGIGIAEQDMGLLFEPFRQIDSALTRRYDGSGLGLHLSRQLVELHNGCIQVSSEPGKGSTFTILLPCGLPG